MIVAVINITTVQSTTHLKIKFSSFMLVFTCQDIKEETPIGWFHLLKITFSPNPPIKSTLTISSLVYLSSYKPTVLYLEQSKNWALCFSCPLIFETEECRRNICNPQKISQTIITFWSWDFEIFLKTKIVPSQSYLI